MKSIKTLAYMGAIALLSVGLMSCHKDEPENNFTDANGNYKGETVKTQFMISIAGSDASASKRNMQGADVQASGAIDDFRGMQNIYLIPYGAQVNNGTEADPIYVLPERVGKTISLDNIPAVAGATYGDGHGNAGGSGINKGRSIYYSDIAIPLGTQNFLFYGEALGTEPSNSTNVANLHKYGAVNVNFLGVNNTEDKEKIFFNLVSIYSEGTPKQAQELANYLTGIAKAEGWADSEKNSEAINELYNRFISMEAGSSASILALVEDLYNTCALYQSTLIEEDEVIGKVMEAIETKATPSATYPYTLTLDASLAGYPGNINLPDGAAKVKWYDEEFAVVEESIEIGSISTPALSNYVYPASLMYYAQSTIKTSVDSKADLYDGSNTWDAILDEYEQGNEVKNTTASVALVDEINYGVGQLKTTVVLGSSTLKDNSYPTEKTIKIANDAKLDWTAVLVGNQKSVGYDFTLNTIGANDDATYTIYDNAVPNAPVTLSTETANAPVNYTLVFSTADNEGNGDDKVYIAIELVNKSGEDFTGVKQQIIPAGSKFYLVGELASKTGVAKLPKNNIFYKDFVTVANLTITSLKNAYNTIPDLRSEKLELGFSVDLEWQEGFTFDIEL